jgi:hypothetical protein
VSLVPRRSFDVRRPTRRRLFIHANISNLWQEPNGGDVVFPLRKGEAYLFQFFEVADGYEGFGVSQSMLVDVTWSGGRKAPTVVVR